VGHCGSPESVSPSVVFITDPSILFGTAVEMIRLLNIVERLPATLVVAVGYRVTNNDVVLGPRTRDLSPSIDTSDPADDPALMGGADQFLAFFRDEPKPWVRDRYGVDPDDSTFFGDSLGGLFATYVLLNEPATFRRYGIGSPSLWWDDKMIFEREAHYARGHHDLAGKVFFSVGVDETPHGSRRLLEQLRGDACANAEAQDAFPSFDMVGDAERMVALLRGRAYPSLDLAFEVLPWCRWITTVGRGLD
jgi:predicted alpha/beta superfamily hydrolase